MKYLLTTLKPHNHTHLQLEEVIPARTGHIKGYGYGVTFTSRGANWEQSPSCQNTKMLEYSAPVVIPQ